jgi:hypothetical protein
VEHDNKTSHVKAWIRERILFLAVTIFVLGAVAYITSGTLMSPDSMWLHPIKEFALLISMIGVASLGYELFLRELTFNEYKEALQEIVNSDAARLGIKGIYKSRSELGRAHSFEKLFRGVQGEIFIGGTSLLSISTNSRELLKERVLRGITVKLLLMNPYSPAAKMIDQQGGDRSTFINEVKTSLLLLEKLLNEIEQEPPRPKDVRGQFLVHLYDEIPSHSFISLDAGQPWGMVIADIGPYLGRNTPRPSMVVVNKKDGLYDYWTEMNNAMWATSRVYGPESRPDDFQSKTMVFVSGKETECLDPKAETWRPAVICRTPNSWRGIKGSQWVWIKDSPSLEEAKTGSKHRFRLQFRLPPGAHNQIVRAELLLRADDVCRVTVNDQPLEHEYGGAEFSDPFVVRLDPYLKDEVNTLLFELINFARPDAASPEDNYKGLIYRLGLEYRQ